MGLSSGSWLAGGLIAFLVAVLTTPAGVSGAVFLLPVQVSVLHVPSPSLTPTNLLYNVLATPGSLVRYARSGRLRSPLTRALLLGTLPGVVVGAVVRVEFLSGPRAFLLVVAVLLLPLGASLLLRRGSEPCRRPQDADRRVTATAALAGLIGGVYGIGGGSLLGPVLAYMGYSLYAVAPAALTTTWVTSIAGVVTYQLLGIAHPGESIAPTWTLGLSMGVGGLLGGYVGASLQARIQEVLLRRLLGALCIVLALRYAAQALDVR